MIFPETSINHTNKYFTNIEKNVRVRIDVYTEQTVSHFVFFNDRFIGQFIYRFGFCVANMLKEIIITHFQLVPHDFFVTKFYACVQN